MYHDFILNSLLQLAQISGLRVRLASAAPAPPMSLLCAQQEASHYIFTRQLTVTNPSLSLTLSVLLMEEEDGVKLRPST